MESKDNNPADAWLQKLDQDSDGDSIHEGISDDELDELLSGDIKDTKSLKNPVTNEDLSDISEHNDLINKLFGADEPTLTDASGEEVGTLDADADDDLDHILNRESDTDNGSSSFENLNETSFESQQGIHELGAESEVNLLDEVKTEQYQSASVDLADELSLDAELVDGDYEDGEANAKEALDSKVDHDNEGLQLAPVESDLENSNKLEDGVAEDNELSIQNKYDSAQALPVDSQAEGIVAAKLDTQDNTANIKDDVADSVSDTKVNQTTAIASTPKIAISSGSTTSTQEKAALTKPTARLGENKKDVQTVIDQKVLTGDSTTAKTSSQNGKSITPSPNTQKGTTKMQNTQQTQIEKILSDIDELKRKLHGMNSDFYNAATDSAVLISEVRQLEVSAKEGQDFSGTYQQSRDLRRTLVEARKSFNTLASAIDELEEALETDLYAVQKS